MKSFKIYLVTVTTIGEFGGYKSDELPSASSRKDEFETDSSLQISFESSDTDDQTFVHINWNKALPERACFSIQL